MILPTKKYVNVDSIYLFIIEHTENGAKKLTKSAYEWQWSKQWHFYPV